MSESSKKIGRPSSYTEEVGNLLCERMGCGESLRTVCEDPTMPSRPSVVRWRLANPEFRDQYQTARQALLEFWEHQIIDISDGVDINGDDGQSIVLRDRLRIDSRKWIMSKLAPKKYGDQTNINVTGKVLHSHIHKTDKQIMADLRTFREERRKRVENKAKAALPPAEGNQAKEEA